jgi:Na+-translocating ferredoxin:NAD+ oxidoreductase RnfG subunit
MLSYRFRRICVLVNAAKEGQFNNLSVMPHKETAGEHISRVAESATESAKAAVMPRKETASEHISRVAESATESAKAAVMPHKETAGEYISRVAASTAAGVSTTVTELSISKGIEGGKATSDSLAHGTTSYRTGEEYKNCSGENHSAN